MFRLSTVLVLSAFCLLGADRSAQARGVILRGESLDLGTIGESIPLSDGRWIDVRSLSLPGPVPAHSAQAILVHDLATGSTELGSNAIATRLLVSLEGAGSGYVGGLLTSPGVLIVYESGVHGPASVEDAVRFTLHDPFAGGGVFLADPAVPLPEPRSVVGLAIGGFALLGLARGGQRRFQRGSPGD